MEQKRVCRYVTHPKTNAILFTNLTTSQTVRTLDELHDL